jgi:exo-beta-1,3-glucanase (GH17 family)
MKTQTRTLRFLMRNLSLLFVVIVFFSTQTPRAAVPANALGNTVISISPSQMSFDGDIATKANTVGHCTESWLSTMPEGSIILGVDPNSCDPLDWDGASASVSVFLPNVYPRTIYVLELSWPDQDGKGLHSPLKNQTASILFDNHPVWNKKTSDLGDFGDYYGAQHESIKTTVVVSQSSTHTLSFTVPPKTAWDLSKIELRAYAMPSKIQGVGYSPYRDCQYPGGSEQPSTENIQEDLTRLFHTSNAIRTYSSTGVNSQIPALAASLGLPIFVGAWLDNNTNDGIEIQGLINLAHSYNLNGVIVGNEYYLRHRTAADIEYLRQKIVQVKNNIPAGIPVTTAEIDDLMFDWTGAEPVIRPIYRPILDEADIVMVHIYPLWSGLPIDGAANFTIAHYKAIQSLIEREYPGQHKRVIIGETGWPSAGDPQAQAVPSLQNQRRYLLEFFSLAEQQGVEYFYFDGFDELWKIEEPGRIGQNWGYSYSDRSAKHSFYGTLLPSEQLSYYNVSPLSLKTSDLLNQPISAVPTEFIEIDSSQQHFLSTPPTTDIAAQSGETFSVYNEWPEGPGHFVPSGWMGDISSIELFGCDRSNPHSGEMAMRFSFSSTGTLGWAGVYWQYPENNWGNINGGLDLSWANKLSFWAKGARGGEKVKFLVGGIGTNSDPYPDSLSPAVSTGFIELTGEWQNYTIDLRGKNLTHLIGGFGWVTDKCANPDGATFYVDDIFFEHDPNMPNPLPHGSVFPVYTDASAQDNHFIPSSWMGDGAVPGRVMLNECWTDNPHNGKTAVKISYTQKVIGWAGVYWVEPAGNIGDRPGGIDLTGAKRVTFWARSDAPGAQVKFIIGGIGYNVDWNGNALCNQPNGLYPDSVCPKIEQTETLNTSWTKYVIDLSAAPRDLHSVVGGFGWVSTQPLTFYLDDIVYEFELSPLTITGNTGVAGVTLTYTDGTPQFVTADGNGNYSLSVSSVWSGTVTPHKIGYSFTPANRSYTNVLSNQTGQNYTAAVCASCADKDTTGVFRPSNGLLYLKNLNITGFADVGINYGLGGDYPVVGDWDGNGTATIGIYRNGSFYLRNSNTLGFADLVFAFGLPGDQPIAGDWDGNGTDTIGLYRPSTGQFLLRNSNSSGLPDMSFYLGNVGDVGIAGDWDGDGKDTTGVFRPSNGVIFLKNTNTTGFADIALNYGLAGDQPVTGDWDGDGIDTIGVYRNGVFYLRNSNTIGFADLVFGLGNPGDMPIAGDWDSKP